MPICLHYLAGVCSRDNCLYPHIKHGADASVCKVFLRGYCEKAEKVVLVIFLEKFLAMKYLSLLQIRFCNYSIKKIFYKYNVCKIT